VTRRRTLDPRASTLARIRFSLQVFSSAGVRWTPWMSQSVLFTMVKTPRFGAGRDAAAVCARDAVPAARMTSAPTARPSVFLFMTDTSLGEGVLSSSSFPRRYRPMRRLALGTILSAAVGISLAHAQTPPETIFADGFESGDLSAWSFGATDGEDLTAQ